jgi:hypothetical protein
MKPTVILKPCLDCGKEITIRPRGIKTRKRCLDCAKTEAKRCAKKQKQVLREQVLQHYSNGTMQCACCGEAHTEFLTIHHINGDGAEHRRELARLRNTRNKRSDKPEQGYTKHNVGNEINRWLIKSNFPEGFSVLCLNCNAAKHYYGECPHEKENNF